MCIFLVGTGPLFLLECSVAYQKKKNSSKSELIKKKILAKFFIFFCVRESNWEGGQLPPHRKSKMTHLHMNYSRYQPPLRAAPY